MKAPRFNMKDTDKIIAAICAASALSGKADEPAAYFDAHEQFIGLMEDRAKAKKKPMKISADLLAKSKKMTRR
jgi:hypothetical protein